MHTGLQALGRGSVGFTLTVQPLVENTSTQGSVTFTVILSLSLIHLRPCAWVPCGEYLSYIV
jgi:hypothetical protein